MDISKKQYRTTGGEAIKSKKNDSKFSPETKTKPEQNLFR